MRFKNYFPLWMVLVMTLVSSCETDEISSDCTDFELILNEDNQLGAEIQLMVDENMILVDGAKYTWVIEEQEDKHEISGNSDARLNWTPKTGETQFCLTVEAPGCAGTTSCFTYTLEPALDSDETDSEENDTDEEVDSEDENEEGDNEENDNEDEGDENEEEEGDEEDGDEDEDSSTDSDDASEGEVDGENDENEADEESTDQNQDAESGNESNDEETNGSTESEEDAESVNEENNTDGNVNVGEDYSPNCLGEMQRIFLTSCHFKVVGIVREGNDESAGFTANQTLLKFNGDGTMEVVYFEGTANEVTESFGTWGSLSGTCQLQINATESSPVSGDWNFDFSPDGNTLQLEIDEENKATLVKNCIGG